MSEIELTPEFQRTLDLIHKGTPLIFVTGGAGTGKSTLIHHIRDTLNKQIAIAAPTGVAALNVQGATLHSLFRLPPAVVRPEDIKKVSDPSLYENLDLLIIDEISMVRPDVLDGVDSFLRLNRGVEEPFGGLQLLLVGDMFQLPPVVKDEDQALLVSMGYESEFFFSARCMMELELTPVLLTRIFRQSDKDFAAVLNNIRQARDVSGALQVINGRTGPEPAGAQLVLTGTNAAADGINEREMARLSGPSETFKGEITGNFGLGNEKLPAPFELTLKKGARVMFTRNDPQKRWVNGSMGVVESVHAEYVCVRMTEGETGASHNVEPAAWEQYKYEYDNWEGKVEKKARGSYKQFPLMPAWAVTIHKAQGKTLPGVFIDFGNYAFAPGQVYVALSRVRRLEDITLKRPVRPEEVRVSPSIAAFHKLVEDSNGKSFTLLPDSGKVQKPVPARAPRAEKEVEKKEDLFVLPKAYDFIFKSSGERKMMEKNGLRLTKLMNGEIPPENETDMNFLRVCRKEIKPMTDMENLWNRYMLRKDWLSEPGSRSAMGPPRRDTNSSFTGDDEAYRDMRRWRNSE